MKYNGESVSFLPSLVFQTPNLADVLCSTQLVHVTRKYLLGLPHACSVWIRSDISSMFSNIIYGIGIYCSESTRETLAVAAKMIASSLVTKLICLVSPRDSVTLPRVLEIEMSTSKSKQVYNKYNCLLSPFKMFILYMNFIMFLLGLVSFIWESCDIYMLSLRSLLF